MSSSGVTTLLLTDVEGSTRAWQESPDAMSSARVRHDQIVREVAKAHGGSLSRDQGEGDSAMIVFDSPIEAIVCALDMQRAFAIEPWPGGLGLRVRMAVHAGEVERRDGNYYGSAVSLCSRIRGLAHGGQTLVSASVRELTKAALPADVDLKDLGLHPLRDFAAPETIYQLCHPDVPGDFPPLRGPRRHGLPAPVTSFIGREVELGRIGELLDGNRLVTLTGPGGSGKTRLALRAADIAAEELAVEAVFVDLAPISDGSTIAFSAARAIGVKEDARTPIEQSLLDYLGDRAFLIVLDNCEHLVVDAARFADLLLKRTTAVRVLATSREPLGIPGEMIFPVPPLPTPQAAPGSLEECLRFESVRLFVDRASSAQSTFSPSDSDAQALAEIARRLDGIPLALELAAARVRVLSPVQLCERLSDRFRLLTGGSRVALGRQQTLRALVDWSYDLLSEPERTVLRRTSVFAGDFGLGAAEEICAFGDVARDDLLDLLTQLVDKSVVIADVTGWEPRYRLLETIREYAREKALDAGEFVQLRDRHLAFFLEMAQRGRRALITAEMAPWLARIDADKENFVSALEWACESEGHTEQALRLVGGLGVYWPWTAPQEGEAWSLRVLALPGGSAPARVSALGGLVNILEVMADYPSARDHAEEAIRLAGDIDDRRTWDRLDLLDYLDCVNHACWGAIRLGEFERARAWLETALVEAHSVVDAAVVVSELFYGLAAIARYRGDLERAEILAREAMAEALKSENPLLKQMGYRGLAEVAFDRGDMPAARQHARAALRVVEEEARFPPGIASYIASLAQIALVEGDPGEARRLADQALEIVRDEPRGTRRVRPLATRVIAEILAREGRYEQAATHIHDVTRAVSGLGDKTEILESLQAWVAIATIGNDFETAAIVSGALDALRSELPAPVPPVFAASYEAQIEKIRSSLGDGVFEEARARGRDLGVEGIVDTMAEPPVDRI